MSGDKTVPEEITRWVQVAEQDAVTCFALPTRWEGGDVVVPAIVIKGPPGCSLERPEIIVTVVGMEAPECPVVAVGVGLPYQTKSLRRQYWCLMPIHADAEICFLRLMASVPAWAVLVAAGDDLTEPQFANVGDATTAGLEHLLKEVGRRPPMPGADVQRAVARVREVFMETWPELRS